MNALEAEKSETPAPRDSKKLLLEEIKALRSCVGEGLNDVEFTHFLLRAALPAESGFEFLSFSNRFVTLSVPKQAAGSWYGERGWVIEEKVKLAREIAGKYGLTLYHPPDVVGAHHVALQSESSHACHHLEMSHNREIQIVVHPLYLKIRLAHTTGTVMHGSGPHRTPHLHPELLKDLSALYQSKD